MKQDTAIKKLIDSLKMAKKLGLDLVNIDELIGHIQLYQEKELQQLKFTFMEGRDFQSIEENKEIYFEQSALDYIEKNFIYYI